VKSNSYRAETKVTAAIQAYIDAYDRQSGTTPPADIFLGLPVKIQNILVRNVPAEDLYHICIAAIQKRRRLVTLH
jgi:hypothetical protein